MIDRYTFGGYNDRKEVSMICTITTKLGTFTSAFTNARDVVDGECRCMACEVKVPEVKEFSPGYSVNGAMVNFFPNGTDHKPEEKSVTLGVCKRCAADFAQYGCD